MQLKLSVQALNAMMMALQKALSEETDIVPTLAGFDWEIYDADGVRVGMEDDNNSVLALWVKNPQVVQVLGFDEDEIEDDIEVETNPHAFLLNNPKG